MAMLVSDLVHPTAIIDPEAIIAPSVQIGPYTIIEGPVEIGPDCVIEGQACITGPLTMGSENYVGHGAILGKSPQHRGYRGEQTSVRIGNQNVFRELVTVNRGTAQGTGETWIGDRNLFMIGSHVGHDARIGNGCNVVNYALIAGHAILDDGCILSGHSAVQQRVRIGRLAMLGGISATSKDIPPFVLQQGLNCVTGLNIIGLRRAGCPPRNIDAVKQAFRIYFCEGNNRPSALDRIEAEFGSFPEVMEFIDFIRQSKNGINQFRSKDSGQSSHRMI